MAQYAANIAYVGPRSIEFGMMLGTLVGVAVKYFLDRTYIFRFSAKTLSRNITSAAQYVTASVLTTLVFWITEYIFDQSFSTLPMRYFGAAIGLGIGYSIKYQIDKRFAFR